MHDRAFTHRRGRAAGRWGFAGDRYRELSRCGQRLSRVDSGGSVGLEIGASTGGLAVSSGERTPRSWRWGRFRIGAALTGVVSRPMWGLLLAGSVLLLLAIPGVGTATAAVTIDSTNHTVTTSRLAIQFGNATTNTPDDPERIDSVKWTGSSGVQTANLAASGGSACGDGREWWGESYGATEGEPPYLVAGGSTGTWASPGARRGADQVRELVGRRLWRDADSGQHGLHVL